MRYISQNRYFPKPSVQILTNRRIRSLSNVPGWTSGFSTPDGGFFCPESCLELSQFWNYFLAPECCFGHCSGQFGPLCQPSSLRNSYGVGWVLVCLPPLLYVARNIRPTRGLQSHMPLVRFVSCKLLHNLCIIYFICTSHTISCIANRMIIYVYIR